MRHKTTKAHRRGPLLALALVLASLGAHAADPGPLPPPVGPVAPRVEPTKEEDGLYHQSWFQLSFLNLKDDFAEAKAAGKRFAVIFEQRGCPYCIKLHTEVLAQQLHQRLRARELHASCSSTCGARARSPTSTARCCRSGRWPSAGA